MPYSLKQFTSKWRWAHDSWLTDDKGFHCFGSAYLFLALIKFLPLFHALIITTILGLLWEIKDAIFPYERYGFLGGDGFSYKDLTANIIGILFGYLLIF